MPIYALVLKQSDILLKLTVKFTIMSVELEKKLLFKIRALIVFFIVSLILSGATAFPIETQLAFAVDHLAIFPEYLGDWIQKVYIGIKTTNANFPFIGYGTDWLAFAHLVIAVVFIGPYINPAKNIWVIQFGMIACMMVFPLALIAGPIREIPFYWRLIDCLFGVIGFIPLYYCYKKIKQLETCIKKNKINLLSN